MNLGGRATQSVAELIDALGIGLLFAETGMVLGANRSFCEMVGRSVDEIRGLADPMLLLPADERRRSAELHAAAIAGGGIARFHSALLDADGERVPVDTATAFGVRDDGVVEVVVAFANLREHSRKEVLLEQYVTLVERLPVGVFVWDSTGVEDPLDLPTALWEPCRDGVATHHAGGSSWPDTSAPVPGSRAGRRRPTAGMRGTDRVEYLGEATYGDEETDKASLYRSRAVALPDGLVAVVFEDITRDGSKSVTLRPASATGRQKRRRAAALGHGGPRRLHPAARRRLHPDPGASSSSRLHRQGSTAGDDRRRTARVDGQPAAPRVQPQPTRTGGVRARGGPAECGGSPVRRLRDRPRHRGSLQREPPDVVQTAVFRIAAEALANVRRHSHATAAAVAVVDDGREVRAVITDNGVGPLAAAEPGHIGLRSMRERAAALGGRCTVAPGPHGRHRGVSRTALRRGASSPRTATPADRRRHDPRGDRVSASRLDSLIVAAADARKQATISRMRLLRAVAMVKAVFDPGLTEHGVVTRAAPLIAEALPDGCMIWLISTAEHGLQRAASWHPDPRQLDLLDTFGLIDEAPWASYAATALRSREPLLLERAGGAFLSEAAPDVPPGPGTVHSTLLAPLISDSSECGLLVVRDRTEDHFGDEDVEFATCLASQLARALTLARAR